MSLAQVDGTQGFLLQPKNEYSFSFVLGGYLRVELLSLRMDSCLTSLETARRSSKVAVSFYQQCKSVLVALYPHHLLVLWSFLF